MVLPAFFIMVVRLSPLLHEAPYQADPHFRAQAALVAYPKSRHILFPPVEPPVGVPPSATDPLNRKGDESTIAGVDHPIEHRSRSEQIEEQAWEFTNLVQRFGARVVVGGKAGGRQGNAEVGKKRHVEEADDDSDDDSELDDEEQELHEVAQQDGLGAAAHKERKEKKMSDRKRRKQQAKEAKVKRDAMIGNAAKTSQDILGAIADFAEIFAKYALLIRPSSGSEGIDPDSNLPLQHRLAAQAVPAIPRPRDDRDSDSPPARYRLCDHARQVLGSARQLRIRHRLLRPAPLDPGL